MVINKKRGFLLLPSTATSPALTPAAGRIRGAHTRILLISVTDPNLLLSLDEQMHISPVTKPGMC